MPDDVAVNFDVATANEEADAALDNAIRAMDKLEFDSNDLKFFFIQAELKMKRAQVKKQYTKFLALSAILPKGVSDEVKHLLVKQETDLGNTPYKKLKNEIFKIFGPPPNADFERAMSRVLTGKPSQLAKQLINDLCDHELTGCCCHKFIFGLWYRQLPTSVREGISHLVFSGDTYEQVLSHADNIFGAGKHGSGQIAALAAVSPQGSGQSVSQGSVQGSPGQGDMAFHQYWPDPATVAAVSFNRGRGQGGRGGRGGRGGQGQGQGRGGRGGRGGQQGQAQGGGGQTPSQTQAHPRHRGTRHPDGPPIQACKQHWIHGKSAFHCLEPGTCPWRDFFVPRANNQ